MSPPRKKDQGPTTPAAAGNPSDPYQEINERLDREIFREVLNWGARLTLQHRDLTKGRTRVRVVLSELFTVERLAELLK